MSARRYIAAFVTLLLVSVAVASPPPTVSEMPPWLRLLRGEDRKKAEALEAGRYATYAEMVTAYEELVTLRTRVQGAEHHETIDERWRLDRFRKLEAMPPDRQQAWVQGLRIAQQAGQLEAQGRHREALPLLREFTATCEAILGENDPQTANCYTKLARCLGDQGNVAEALPLIQKSLQIRRQTLGENHPATAYSYDNLGHCLKDQGKVDEALLMCRKALRIKRHVLGESHLDLAGSYNNLAFCLRSLGRAAEALPLFRKALSMRLQILGENHALTATCYSNLALCLQAQGKPGEALPYYRKALRIREQTLGDRHPDTGASYHNLGYCLNSLGKEDEAYGFFQLALQIHLKTRGENHPHMALMYDNLALSLQARGKTDAALELLEKALRISRQTRGDIHPDTALNYYNQAFCLLNQGKSGAALAPSRKALDIRRQTLGEYHHDTAGGFMLTAACLQALGRPAEAAEYYEKALLGFEYGRLSASESGLERSLFRADRATPHSLLSAILVQLGKPEDAWHHAESNSGRGLLDQLTGSLLLSDKEQQKLALVRSLEAQLLPLLTHEKPTGDDIRQIQTLRAVRDRLQGELAAAAVRQARGRVLPLNHIQSHIPEDAALVFWTDVATVNQHLGCVLRSEGGPCWVRVPGSGQDAEWTHEDRSLILRTRDALAGSRQATSPIRVLRDALARQRLAPLEPHLQGVRHLYVVPAGWMAGVPVSALTDRYTVSYVPSGTYLARMMDQPRQTRTPHLLALGDPLFGAPLLAQTNTDLPEHGLLIAQVQPGGNAQWGGLRAGDVLLSYGAQKLTTLDSLQTRAGVDDVPVEAWREGKVLKLTVAAGPLGIAIDKRPVREALVEKRAADNLLASVSRGPQLAALPGTRREVESLAALFGKHDVLLGSNASEARLGALVAAKQLGRYTHLHFATHGTANDDKAFESSLYLAQDTLPDNADLVARGLKPIDGRLTAREVLENWKLDADLVVLSACESGLGKLGGGDGLLGFSQAFLHAGARSVVLSLWPVDDTATALLMRRFYQNLLGKRDGLEQPLGKAAALQEAREWLRNLDDVEAKSAEKTLRGPVREKPAAVPSSAKPYAHPHYWAAFILIGDPG